MQESAGGLTYLTGGSFAYAGSYLHDTPRDLHTHSFLEIAVVTGGSGVHRSMAGRQPLARGDVLVLRPGVWHGYEDCPDLVVYNCCVSTDLLEHELAWTREDPLLGYLLWTGPMSRGRQGMLTVRLDGAALEECVARLTRLDELRRRPRDVRRAETIGQLLLVASTLAAAAWRARETDEPPAEAVHPLAARAMGLLEARPAHRWTLAEVAADLHITPGYLVRVFKSAAGLPPMAYLARRRVELAASLLLHTEEPVTSIASSVGWPDQNYFARRFRAHVGMSATAYRRRFGNVGAGTRVTEPDARTAW